MSSPNDRAPGGGPRSRAELKRAYKETPLPMGVFIVRNRINGKVRLGTSVNLPGALNRERFQLTLGSHPLRALQEDWNRYGAEAFTLEVLDLLPPTEEPRTAPAEELKVLEALWLERLKPYGEAGYHAPPPPDPKSPAPEH